MLGVGDFLAMGFIATLIKKPRFEIRARLLHNRLLTRLAAFRGGRRASRGESRRHGGCERDRHHDEDRCRERYCDLFQHDHPPRARQAPSQSRIKFRKQHDPIGLARIGYFVPHAGGVARGLSAS
jgi:hypothetical protein